MSNSGTQLSLSPSSGLYVLYKIAKIRDPIVKAKNNSIISRGLGSSYGDASQLNNESVLNLQYFNHINLRLLP